MSIELALADAARNCSKEDALATITMRSGAYFTGKLERQSGADLGTRLLRTPEGYWVTFKVEEVAAVESHR